MCSFLHQRFLHGGSDFWRDDMDGVAELVSESLDVMLGADSDNQGQASDQPS